MIAIVSALREELAPLLRRAKIDRVIDRRFHVGTLSGTAVVMTVGGDGLQRAENSVRDLLQRFDNISLLIGVGIAGGIDPALRSGDVIVAKEVRGANGTWAGLSARQSVVIRSVDHMIGSVEEKRAIADSTSER